MWTFFFGFGPKVTTFSDGWSVKVVKHFRPAFVFLAIFGREQVTSVISGPRNVFLSWECLLLGRRVTSRRPFLCHRLTPFHPLWQRCRSLQLFKGKEWMKKKMQHLRWRRIKNERKWNCRSRSERPIGRAVNNELVKVRWGLHFFDSVNTIFLCAALRSWNGTWLAARLSRKKIRICFNEEPSCGFFLGRTVTRIDSHSKDLK